jgi:hypothetical protein
MLYTLKSRSSPSNQGMYPFECGPTMCGNVPGK